MARSIEDIIIRKEQQKQRTGSEFEKDTFRSLNTAFPKLQNHIGNDLDVNEGTDFTNNDVRIDATLDFRHKDFMPFSCDTGIEATPIHNFQLGIRLGNSHKGFTEFPEPVVVIGLDMTSQEYRTWQDVIEENMVANANGLMFAINDAYLDYITDDKEERKELFSQPLRPNKSFEKPKNLSKRFEDLNELQYSIMEQKDEGDQYI